MLLSSRLRAVLPSSASTKLALQRRMTNAPAPSTVRLGLERILPLLGSLGSPQGAFPVIHIAGTNAKGTTSSVLDSLLRYAGLNTARFNSPHLRFQRDSCRINGDIIDEVDWREAGAVVESAIASTTSPDQPSDFERLFARFLVACRTRSWDETPVLIVECGMGGLTDATNVFDASNVLASVITPISGDHKAQLGGSLASITEHKMGIAKSDGLLVVADQRQAGMSALSFPSVWGSESPEAFGPSASEIYSTIHSIAKTLNASVVRCETPFQALGQQASRQAQDECQWAIYTDLNLRLAPSMHLSERGQSTDGGQASSFSPRPGSTAIVTPTIARIAPTMAALTGLSTALSTMLAIASNEPPSAHGFAGSDPHEDLRLRLAWTLRNSGLFSGETGMLDPSLNAAVVAGVEQWEGRGSWVQVPPVRQSAAASQDSNHSAGLQLYVDGAHNEGAVAALTNSIRAMLAHRHIKDSGSSLGGTSLTLIVSLSSGKQDDGDVDRLLLQLLSLREQICKPTATAASGDLGSTGEMSQALLEATSSQPLRQRIDLTDLLPNLDLHVFFVPFETPVEGMPWVRCLEPQWLSQRFQELQRESRPSDAMQEDTISVASYAAASLEEALDTISNDPGRFGDGKPAVETSVSQRDSMLVLTGSLYLVGQLYRLLDKQS